MSDLYIIDFNKTYNGAILQAVEPKTEMGAEEQAKDKDGVLKWLVYLNMEVKSTGKKKFENITITFTNPTKPYAAIPLNSPVIIENLALGKMPRKEGGYTFYFMAEAIRPVQPVRLASGQ